ncbi:MAG: hypothetical protein KBS70_04395 [Bacteroidales bacterium]|nr:hypothetical protein [Candidatus Colicola equi]
MKNKFKFLATMLIGILLSTNVWGAVEYNEIAWGDINSDDTIIIVGVKSGDNYVMVQATPPTPTKVTISSDKITTFTANTEFVAEVTGATIKFRVADGVTGTNAKYLLGKNDNNGLSVAKPGSNSNVFSIDNTASGGPRMNFTYTKQRWCGIYNKQDWRCYESKDATNIKDTKTLFFKKKDATPAYTITAQSNNVAYGTVSLSGKKITASPNTGYTYASPAAYTVTSGTATVVQDGNEFTVTPESDCTVRINFAAKQIATITLMEAGTPVAGPSGKYSGETYTLPSSVTNVCDGKTFVGWSTVDITMPGDKPTENYYGKGAEVTLAATNTFYAVYAEAEGGADPVAYTAGDEGSFVLAALNDGKWYALPTNPTVSSGKITGVEISVSQTGGGVNYVTTENATGFTWTIANATNGQTISDGTKYIYHKNGGSSDTNLDYGTGTTYTWTIESETNGLTFKGTNGTTINNRGMLVSGTTFGGYALSNEDQSGYYRISVLPISGATYSNYTTCGSKYSVTFKNQESVISTTEYTAGTVIHAPATAENTCGEGFFFVGWLAQPLYVGATPNPKPAGLIQPNGEITVPAEDVVYYAVFATKVIN